MQLYCHLTLEITATLDMESKMVYQTPMSFTRCVTGLR